MRALLASEVRVCVPLSGDKFEFIASRQEKEPGIGAVQYRSSREQMSGVPQQGNTFTGL